MDKRKTTITITIDGVDVEPGSMLCAVDSASETSTVTHGAVIEDGAIVCELAVEGQPDPYSWVSRWVEATCYPVTRLMTAEAGSDIDKWFEAYGAHLVEERDGQRVWGVLGWEPPKTWPWGEP